MQELPNKLSIEHLENIEKMKETNNINKNNINNINNKNSKLNKIFKPIIILLVILILTAILITLLFKMISNSKQEKNVEETQIITETARSNLKIKERHDLILEKLEQREILVIEEEKFKNGEIKSNARIQKLKEEGIRSNILEFLIELKNQEILFGDDLYIEKSNILKIGKISETMFSYELKIRSIEEILQEKAAEEAKKEKAEKEKLPFEEYLEKKKTELETQNQIEKKENTDITSETDNTENQEEKSDEFNEEIFEESKLE